MKVPMATITKPNKFETLNVEVFQLRSAMEYDRLTNPVKK